jgi:phosphopantetheinyl transferase
MRALGQMMLNRAERESFGAMTGAVVERRAEWLLGRIAAKDAVRALLGRDGAEAIYPADVEIAAEAEGRPYVSAPWLSEPPHISIAHKAGRAVALAGARRGFAGVGIDIETIEERRESFVEAAYSSAEQALLAAVPAADRALAMTRIWCAKEAVGKALGLALADILCRLEAEDCGESVRVALRSPAEGAAAAFDVATVRDGNFLVALVAIPQQAG